MWGVGWGGTIVSAGPVATGGVDTGGEVVGHLAGVGVGGDALAGPAYGGEDGGVIAASEGPADGGERGVGELAGEVHGELARPGESGDPAGGEQLVAGQAELVAHHRLDVVDGGGP